MDTDQEIIKLIESIVVKNHEHIIYLRLNKSGEEMMDFVENKEKPYLEKLQSACVQHAHALKGARKENFVKIVAQVAAYKAIVKIITQKTTGIPMRQSLEQLNNAYEDTKKAIEEYQSGSIVRAAA